MKPDRCPACRLTLECSCVDEPEPAPRCEVCREGLHPDDNIVGRWCSPECADHDCRDAPVLVWTMGGYAYECKRCRRAIPDKEWGS